MLDICSASNFRLAWDVVWFNNVCVSRCFAVLRQTWTWDSGDHFLIKQALTSLRISSSEFVSQLGLFIVLLCTRVTGLCWLEGCGCQIMEQNLHKPSP